MSLAGGGNAPAGQPVHTKRVPVGSSAAGTSVHVAPGCAGEQRVQRSAPSHVLSLRGKVTGTAGATQGPNAHSTASARRARPGGTASSPPRLMCTRSLPCTPSRPSPTFLVGPRAARRGTLKGPGHIRCSPAGGERITAAVLHVAGEVLREAAAEACPAEALRARAYRGRAADRRVIATEFERKGGGEPAAAWCCVAAALLMAHRRRSQWASRCRLSGSNRVRCRTLQPWCTCVHPLQSHLRARNRRRLRYSGPHRNQSRGEGCCSADVVFLPSPGHGPHTKSTAARRSASTTVGDRHRTPRAQGLAAQPLAATVKLWGRGGRGGNGGCGDLAAGGGGLGGGIGGSGGGSGGGRTTAASPTFMEWAATPATC